MGFETILTRTDGVVGIVQLNRPEVRNALNDQMIRELVEAVEEFDRDNSVRCIVIAGNDRAFSAGADIKETAQLTPVEMLRKNRDALWNRFRQVSKPTIAAVSGYALGGGFVLSLTCDMIVASDTARFGVPEVSVGMLPSAGGTQRLARALGKARAMELVLTGRRITAQEAQSLGLVVRIAPVESYLDQAIALARDIAVHSPIVIWLAKEAINKAFETSLDNGIDIERKMLCILLSTEDQKEGMEAFLEKRKPVYMGK